MKCPHCLEAFHSRAATKFTCEDRDGEWAVEQETCPACERAIISLLKFTRWPDGRWRDTLSTEFVRPRAMQRPQPSTSVTSPYRDDYIEACAVLPYSPKASAALTRRCLQAVLRDKGGFTQKDLAPQIDAALASGRLPSHISEALDAVRNIGNFAAHPMKSTASGALLDVEPHEAEWNLEVIEALFDFYFVQPDIVQKKKAALNAKLTSAGKPPMK